MTTATVILEKEPTRLSPEATKAFNAVLKKLGMAVLGARGRELVLQVIDRSVADGHADLAKDLLAALARADKIAGWENFNSVAYR